MDITRGSLDDITRPARTSRHRPGSRVSLNSFGGVSSPSGRPLSVASSSLEILPPDPDILLQEDNDLALEEYLSSSEENVSSEHMNGDVNDGRGGILGGSNSEEDDVNIGPGAALIQGMQDRMRNLDLVLAKTDGNDSHAEDFSFLAYSTDQKVRISPDQESSRQTDARSSRSSTREQETGGRGADVENEEEEDELAGVADPELRKALKKMQKLDRILNAKVTREREVKRQRKLLHHQLEVELDSIKEEGGGRSKEASENANRYISLVPPPRHDEGVNMEDIPSTPVFATQVPDGSPAHRASTSSSNEHSTPERKAGRQGRKQSKSSPREATHQRKPRPPRKGGAPGTNADNSDFIQRNIELASDAGNLIAMTDDEKNRLEELLQDVDILAGDPEDEVVSGKLQLNSLAGVGYTADSDSQKMLLNIDEKLKNLLPSDDFTEICSTPSLLGDRRDSFNPEAFELGERLLQDTKAVRTQHQRLRDIDQELANLQNQVDLEISSPSLSKGELDSLLQRCSEASDRTMTEITSPRVQPAQSSEANSPRSPRSQLSSRVGRGEDSPPHEKLSDDALQRLLSEAKASLGMLALENASTGSVASSRTATATPSTMGRDSAHHHQLDISLGDTPRSEMSINTSRSLVSHDMIQQLLKNPRSTMLQSYQQETFDPNMEGEGGMEDDQLNASLEIR